MYAAPLVHLVLITKLHRHPTQGDTLTKVLRGDGPMGGIQADLYSALINTSIAKDLVRWWDALVIDIVRDPLQGFSALLSIVIPIIFVLQWLLRRRKSTSLSFERRHYWIFDPQTDSIPGLDVTLDGKKVDSLTVTEVAFWNSGKDKITSDMAPPEGAMRFRVDDRVQILSAAIIADNCRACGFRGEIDEGDYAVRYNSIYPGKGAILQVLHTSTRPHIETWFETTFLPKTVKAVDVRDLFSRTASVLMVIGGIAMALAFVVLAVNGIANVFSDWSIPYTKNYTGAVFAGGLALAALGGFFNWRNGRHHAIPGDLAEKRPYEPVFVKMTDRIAISRTKTARTSIVGEIVRACFSH